MQENQQITKKEQYNLNKLQKRLRRNVGEAIADFNMIEEGDRIMVCLSGVRQLYHAGDSAQFAAKRANQFFAGGC